MQDPGGRFLFIRGILGEIECTLANIYAPNKNPIRFLKDTLEKLMDFRKGELIVMGDLNMCLEPEIDSTSGAQGTNNGQMRKIKQELHKNQLVDIWRVMNGKTRDYTFYSPVHRTYSRIDYILVDHRLLDRIVGSKIGIITISDHAPIEMEMQIYRAQGRQSLWRINEDLLQNEDISKKNRERARILFFNK